MKTVKKESPQSSQSSKVVSRMNVSPVENGKTFVFIFDCQDGNPNGDPKMQNSPRTKPDNHIWVSSESQKRKIRNRWEQDGRDIFISVGDGLNSKIKKLPGTSEEEKNEALSATYIDVRIFGAVANTGELNSVKAGVVHGPVQIYDATSINIPTIELVQTTRLVATKEDNSHTMGTRYKVNYAAFKGSGSISAVRAAKVNMTEEDEKVFWSALLEMFHDHASNSSGIQRLRKVFVFEGRGKSMDIGIALDAVKTSVKVPAEEVSSFEDIEVALDLTKIPDGVTVTELL